MEFSFFPFLASVGGGASPREFDLGDLAPCSQGGWLFGEFVCCAFDIVKLLDCFSGVAEFRGGATLICCTLLVVDSGWLGESWPVRYMGAGESGMGGGRSHILNITFGSPPASVATPNSGGGGGNREESTGWQSTGTAYGSTQ